MQHPRTDTDSSGPRRGEKEHTAFVHVPLMVGTEVFHGPEIPTSEGNPVSHVQAHGNDNLLSA